MRAEFIALQDKFNEFRAIYFCEKFPCNIFGFLWVCHFHGKMLEKYLELFCDIKKYYYF